VDTVIQKGASLTALHLSLRLAKKRFTLDKQIVPKRQNARQDRDKGKRPLPAWISATMMISLLQKPLSGGTPR